MHRDGPRLRSIRAELFPLAALLASSACAQLTTAHVPAEGALGPYSAAVRSDGFVFVSVKVAPKAAREGEFVAEARGAIDVVETELGRAGVRLADVVNATVFLTDRGHYGAVNEIYAQRFPLAYPARTCVALSALPAGARVEIQVVARAP